MRALRIIEGAAFGPEVLQAASAAFDAAWAEIADRFGSDMREGARVRLATAIISTAREDSTDIETLRRAGLRAMAQEFPSQLSDPTNDKASAAGD